MGKRLDGYGTSKRHSSRDSSSADRLPNFTSQANSSTQPLSGPIQDPARVVPAGLRPPAGMGFGKYYPGGSLH